MELLTFDSFTKKIYIKAPLEKIYWCWATTAGIMSWFLKSAEYLGKDAKVRNASDFIQQGDTYTWEWHNWDGQEKGTVLNANGKDFLEISFAGDCRVAITLHEKGSSILVTLKQYNIPTDEKSKMQIHFGCSNGWTFWLANLKAYLEHGILLNETEHDLRQFPNAGLEFVNM
ncbi:SRPBCC family protein [Sediminicola sp. YIK13]|uniref:SRPBCC family protein n=1 Tax=Sediminicola sp. YIK13 TaxID=1453352 RepID=UPI00078393AA|nr:SRPBCC domain-containing protein [Sediminicola sp. YIK13]